MMLSSECNGGVGNSVYHQPIRPLLTQFLVCPKGQNSTQRNSYKDHAMTAGAEDAM